MGGSRRACDRATGRGLTSQSGSDRGISERAASSTPALARGVSSVSCAGAVFFCLIRCEMICHLVLSFARLFDDAPRAIRLCSSHAVVLVPSAHDATCRAYLAAAISLSDITRAAGVPPTSRGHFSPPILPPKYTSSTSDFPLTWHLKFCKVLESTWLQNRRKVVPQM